MDVLDTFSEDTDSVEQGKWFTIGKDVRIKMRSMSSTIALAHNKKLREPYSAFDKINKDLPEGAEEEISTDMMVDVLILDWEGLVESKTDEDGEAVLDEDGKVVKIPLPYSKREARRLLKGAPKFALLLVGILAGDGSFKEANRKDELKN